MADGFNIRVTGFYKKYKTLRNGEVQEREYVTWVPKGGAMYSSNNERIDHINPAILENKPGFDPDDDQQGLKLQAMRAKWALIEPGYEAWKKGQDIPVDGTPLAAWGGLDADQIKIVQMAGIQSVEDFAEANDSQMERVKLPNRRDLQKQAALFLKNREPSAAAAALTEAQDTIAAMQADMAEMRAAMAEMQKPKRGRPKKAEAEAEAESEAA